MQTPSPLSDRPANLAAYEAARKGGASPLAVRTQLDLPVESAARLETLFRGRVMRGDGDGALPRYARHALHVAAVMAQGGYPALSERRIGRDGACVCLPMRRPSPSSPVSTEV